MMMEFLDQLNDSCSKKLVYCHQIVMDSSVLIAGRTVTSN
jgi:hypothetical protein